jgi:hypothetical protein
MRVDRVGWGIRQIVGVVPPNRDETTYSEELRAGVKAGTHQYIIRPGGVLSIVDKEYPLEKGERIYRREVKGKVLT